MKITVFTSNQPRHIGLVERLTSVATEVDVVMECNTVIRGSNPNVSPGSPVMRDYFSRVSHAEEKLFGNLRLSSSGARTLAVGSGDINSLPQSTLAPLMDADLFVVFGASFIKGWLIEELISRRAINIHMGLSPFYRGSSCNFWALYDSNPNMVGSTIHLLTKGLDSGPILFHVLPKFEGEDPFAFTMKAVVAAQDALVTSISTGKLASVTPTSQDPGKNIRYTRNLDFTDEVAGNFLSRKINADDLARLMETCPSPDSIKLMS